MRKIFLFAAAAMMSTAMFAQMQVATFEEIQLDSAESVLHLDSTGTFQSGTYYFMQDVQDYGDYGVYYFGNIVSNKTGHTYDYYADSDKSASGGAYEGNNFNVWTASYVGADFVMLPVRSVVPGMYVNNTAWVVDAILNGDGMSIEADSTTGKPFGENDYLTLGIFGIQMDLANDTSYLVGSTSVMLAQGTEYIHEWTYVDLSVLGQVDVVTFQMLGSKQNTHGMTTPAYFCMDNFGAAAAEGIDNTAAESNAVKAIRNGQVIITRGDKTYNLLGTEIK